MGNNTTMDVIRESFSKTPSPFNGDTTVTSTMQNSPKFSEILEKSRKVMDLVESRAANKNKNIGSQHMNISNDIRNFDERTQFNGGSVRTMPTTNSLSESFRQMPAISGDGYKTMITENKTSQINSVDYSLIKMIVNECIKDNLQQIKESLNENTIRGIKINPGGVIQVLDKNNNLYEGQLKLKQKK